MNISNSRDMQANHDASMTLYRASQHICTSRGLGAGGNLDPDLSAALDLFNEVQAMLARDFVRMFDSVPCDDVPCAVPRVNARGWKRWQDEIPAQMGSAAWS